MAITYFFGISTFTMPFQEKVFLVQTVTGHTSKEADGKWNTAPS